MTLKLFPTCWWNSNWRSKKWSGRNRSPLVWPKGWEDKGIVSLHQCELGRELEWVAERVCVAAVGRGTCCCVGERWLMEVVSGAGSFQDTLMIFLVLLWLRFGPDGAAVVVSFQSLRVYEGCDCQWRTAVCQRRTWGLVWQRRELSFSHCNCHLHLSHFFIVLMSF